MTPVRLKKRTGLPHHTSHSAGKGPGSIAEKRKPDPDLQDRKMRKKSHRGLPEIQDESNLPVDLPLLHLHRHQLMYLCKRNKDQDGHQKTLKKKKKIE